MEIINFLYRRPSYMLPILKDDIDTIVIHHTGNNNDIHTNTDYHMDHNRWTYLGYAFYIVDGIVYRARGIENKNAAVLEHNHHTVSIAVQGDYNKDTLSDENFNALQDLIYYLKKEVPSIRHIKPHSHLNDTTCCGEYFPWKRLKLQAENYKEKYNELQEKYNELEEENAKLKREKERLIKILERRKIR